MLFGERQAPLQPIQEQKVALIFLYLAKGRVARHPRPQRHRKDPNTFSAQYSVGGSDRATRSVHQDAFVRAACELNIPACTALNIRAARSVPYE